VDLGAELRKRKKAEENRGRREAESRKVQEFIL